MREKGVCRQWQLQMHSEGEMPIAKQPRSEPKGRSRPRTQRVSAKERRRSPGSGLRRPDEIQEDCRET